jgi:hypothetical protein
MLLLDGGILPHERSGGFGHRVSWIIEGFARWKTRLFHS